MSTLMGVTQMTCARHSQNELTDQNKLTLLRDWRQLDCATWVLQTKHHNESPLKPDSEHSTYHLTLMITSAKCVKIVATTANNSPTKCSSSNCFSLKITLFDLSCSHFFTLQLYEKEFFCVEWVYSHELHLKGSICSYVIFSRHVLTKLALSF